MEKRIRFWSTLAGILGAIFPVLLFVLGRFGMGFEIVPTISDYYHSKLKWLFICGLIMIAGMFLILSPIMLKSRATGIAVFCLVVGTAFFPTPECMLEGDHYARTKISLSGYIHVFSAVGLLFLFALILYRIIPKNIPQTSILTPYLKPAGILVVACNTASLALAFNDSNGCQSSNHLSGLIFWLETAAIITFSIAWISYSIVWTSKDTPPITKPSSP